MQACPPVDATLFLPLLALSSPPSPGFLRALGEVIVPSRRISINGTNSTQAFRSVNWESFLTPSAPHPNTTSLLQAVTALPPRWMAPLSSSAISRAILAQATSTSHMDACRCSLTGPLPPPVHSAYSTKVTFLK